MQEQFNSLSKELMGANEERIIKEQEISFWKDKYEVFQMTRRNSSTTRACLFQIDLQSKPIKSEIKFGADIIRTFLSNTKFCPGSKQHKTEDLNST